jgi:hypothetical protein
MVNRQEKRKFESAQYRKVEFVREFWNMSSFCSYFGLMIDVVERFRNIEDVEHSFKRQIQLNKRKDCGLLLFQPHQYI